MKEIVTLSGKGGAGKSSLTAAMGSLLAKEHKLVLVDTDVDAPNLDLVLDAKLKSEYPIAASDKAIIDYDLCSRCMACVEVCRFSSLIGTDEPIVVSYSCEGCGACTLICPTEAISVQPVENGTLRTFSSQGIRIVSGKLGIGESSSGKLVDTVKQKARQDAALLGAELLLTDGPPGIGCPVIASLKGAHLAVLVTEPTPSALSDLQRVVEVTRFFKVPAVVVLNRADMHSRSRDRLRSWLAENELELLQEIPFDRALPEALARGRLGVHLFPDAPSSRAIIELSEKIKDFLSQEI